MKTEKIIFKVSKRDLLGKKVKKLREKGLVVGNIVISGKSSIPIKADALEFERVYSKAGESALVYLSIDSEKKMIPVLIDEAVFNPVNGSISHVVAKQVSLTKKIEASIQIEVIGEFKIDGATLSILQDEVGVKALPTDLPENFEINAENFTEIGQKITLADLDYNKSKVELVLGEDVKPEEVTLILIQEEKLQAEEPEEEVVDEVEEGDEEKEGESKDEGEKSSEEAKPDQVDEKKE